jgi:hypothetical protein
MNAHPILGPDEAELTGVWRFQAGRITADATCERIHWLIEHVLRKVADSPGPGAWETLFQDPNDGRYWERVYPQSEMHGGGPPRVKALAVDEAQRRYGIASRAGCETGLPMA